MQSYAWRAVLKVTFNSQGPHTDKPQLREQNLMGLSHWGCYWHPRWENSLLVGLSCSSQDIENMCFRPPVNLHEMPVTHTFQQCGNQILHLHTSRHPIVGRHCTCLRPAGQWPLDSNSAITQNQTVYRCAKEKSIFSYGTFQEALYFFFSILQGCYKL